MFGDLNYIPACDISFIVEFKNGLSEIDYP
jgi:hypothetical protein